MAADELTAMDNLVAAQLTELTARLDAAASTTMGFPASCDIDWSPLVPRTD
jgi:hypothetical protein